MRGQNKFLRVQEYKKLRSPAEHIIFKVTCSLVFKKVRLGGEKLFSNYKKLPLKC